MSVPTTSVGSERRGPAVIDDVILETGDDPPFPAYLVTPDGPPGPAVLAWHWFDTEADDSDRTQFLDEAVELAGVGVSTLLPQGRFPWSQPPTGAAADVAAIDLRQRAEARSVERASPHQPIGRIRILEHGVRNGLERRGRLRTGGKHDEHRGERRRRT